MPRSSYKAPNFMLRQQAIDWLVRLRSDDIGETEIVAFADWLAQDHTHSEAFVEAESLFDNMVLAAKNPAFDAQTQADSSDWENAGANPVKLRPKHPSVRRTTLRWMVTSLALAAVWLFVVMLVIPTQSHLLNNYLSDYHTETGELREIQLADGSHILLNTNSAVSVDLKATVRQITLHHGQARFAVAKDAQRPFEVISGGLVVRALGTVFEVYKRSGQVSVTVQEHAVAVLLQSEAGKAGRVQPVNVQQGQQLHYHSGGTLQKPEAVELSQSTAWQQHRLFINDRPLGELIGELGRYRVGRIFLSDEKLENLRVTGVFSLDNPDETLSSVRKALDLKETRLGSWWVLLHR
jgi:transmembrane sensor